MSMNFVEKYLDFLSINFGSNEHQNSVLLLWNTKHLLTDRNLEIENRMLDQKCLMFHHFLSVTPLISHKVPRTFHPSLPHTERRENRCVKRAAFYKFLSAPAHGDRTQEMWPREGDTLWAESEIKSMRIEREKERGRDRWRKREGVGECVGDAEHTHGTYRLETSRR